MKRLLATILLLPMVTFGQLFTRTNDILYLQPTDYPIGAQLDTPVQYTVSARINTNQYLMTTGSVKWLVYDGQTGTEMASYNGSFTGSIATVSYTPTFIISGYAKMNYYNPAGALQATISWNNYSVTNPCITCGGGGGGATSVTVTNLNTINSTSTSIVSVVITNIGGGGGGAGTISGINSATTGGVFFVVTNGWDAGIETNGNIFTIRTGLPQGATGVNQVATWNGTNWVAQALGAPSPTPFVGTNVQKWATVWGVTNTWVAPSTQILFTAWGAGASGSGGGGHARAIWVGSAGTIFDIVVGTAGNLTATNNGPFSGKGLNATAAQTNHLNGGGATYIAISGTTNIILIAGGAGGGPGLGSGIGGPGGGFWYTTLDGTSPGTNASGGQGAWASNEYGLAATAGTNFAITGSIQDGSYLQGGNASTNGANVGATGGLGGGGGGWYGGAGATKTNASFGTTANSGAGGGGGLSYADTNYVTFAQLIAGERAQGGVPAAQDHPTYTAGRGVGGAVAGNGANGCAGALW